MVYIRVFYEYRNRYTVLRFCNVLLRERFFLAVYFFSPLVFVINFVFSQTHVNIVAGCCLAMGLKFAGSSNQQAFTTLVCNRLGFILCILISFFIVLTCGNCTYMMFFPLTLCHVISFHFISFHFISFHFISFQIHYTKYFKELIKKPEAEQVLMNDGGALKKYERWK